MHPTLPSLQYTTGASLSTGRAVSHMLAVNARNGASSQDSVEQQHQLNCSSGMSQLGQFVVTARTIGRLLAMPLPCALGTAVLSNKYLDSGEPEAEKVGI